MLKALNELAKRPDSDIKGRIHTRYFLSDDCPIILLPTTGKYVLPEVEIIDKIIRSLEPKDIIAQALKSNAQSGIHLMSAFEDKLRNFVILLVHTPKGCLLYRVDSTEGFNPVPKQSNISDEILSKS